MPVRMRASKKAKNVVMVSSAMVLFGIVMIMHAQTTITNASSSGRILQAVGDCAEEDMHHTGSMAPPMMLLTETLNLSTSHELDEFGNASPFASLAQVVGHLVRGNHVSPAKVAVNIGARDGIGTQGNTDPTWPLYRDQGFQGVVIEGDPLFEGQLRQNFRNMSSSVQPLIKMVTPDNVVGLIESAGHRTMDVLKMDIDGWDCDVLDALLSHKDWGLAVVMAEFNVKFPPPIRMRLATSPRSAYRSCARYHVYGCSLQYLAEDVMGRHGFVLAQVDWQNALFVRASLAPALGMREDRGIDVAEAYQRGYARRERRAANMPWNWDIDHLIEPGISSTQTMARAVRFLVNEGPHTQDGAVEIGCNSKKEMVRVNYKQTHAAREC